MSKGVVEVDIVVESSLLSPPCNRDTCFAGSGGAEE